MTDGDSTQPTVSSTTTPHLGGGETGADTVAIPPRYWWLKRIMLAVAVLLAVVAGLRCWWGVVAERRLEAAIAEIRRRGEPLYAADFVRPPVPDEDNAAYYLKRAAQALVEPEDVGLSLAEVLARPQLCVERPDDVGALLERNREPLHLARIARSKPGVDWGIDFSSGLLSCRLPDMRPQGELAELLCVAALHHHHRGDDAEALETLRDALRLGAALNESRSLPGHFAQLLISSRVATVVEDIAPGLTIAPFNVPDAPATQPATRAQVRALCDVLLDEESLREGWRWAMYSVRAAQLELVQEFFPSSADRAQRGGVPRGQSASGSGSWLVKPAFQLDGVRILEAFTQMVEAGSASNVAAAERAWPEAPSAGSKLDLHTRLLSAFVLPPFNDLAESRFSEISKRRMAAVRLAIRLYEVDRGARPERLAELVADYLPAVPVDPFFEDGRPIGYEPRGPDAGLFVGEPDDALDRRGRPTKTGLARYVASLRLDREPSALESKSGSQPTSTQRVEDGGDVERQQRESDEDVSADADPNDRDADGDEGGVDAGP